MKKNYAVGFLRIAIGWIFLWAFVDKLFGLGFATESSQAWIVGVSPTTGFLSHATSGPFQNIFASLAGVSIVDWLFMGGIFLIGIALVLGIAMRLAVVFGSFFLFLMWLALLPAENNPFLDEHLVYILVLAVCLHDNAGEIWGLGAWWKQRPLVQQLPWLR